MKKTYYTFTYKKFPNIYYSNRNIFNSKIFNSLYGKLGDNSLKWRLRKNTFFSFLWERFFKKEVDVPSTNTGLVYVGYDSLVFFELDSSLEVVRVFRKPNGEKRFVEEEFLGYPPNIFDSVEFKKQAEVLTDFFKKHWLNLLKDEDSLHGDLVPSNMCMKDGVIRTIDSKRIYSDSIVFDHMYFYCYANKKVDERKKLSVAEKLKVKEILDGIFLKSFSEKNLEKFLKETENLKLKKLPFENFPHYKRKFISLLKGQ